MTSISKTWGTTSDERELSFPCDEIIPKPEVALYRGVTVHAPANVIFRWLCQLRVAPYSYDWIDNYGRQSPRELIPGLENLEIGEEVMTIFRLVAFERDRHFTIRIKAGANAFRIFGDIAVSYMIISTNETDTGKGEQSCRLLVKLSGNRPPGFKGTLMGKFLPWGDLIMMRRQLLNLKELSEKTVV